MKGEEIIMTEDLTKTDLNAITLGDSNYINNKGVNFMDLSFRVDGSSLFGTKNKFAPFWSAGIGWNVHNEKFMQSQNMDTI